VKRLDQNSIIFYITTNYINFSKIETPEFWAKVGSQVTPARKLILLIDAIDNAEIAARQRSEDAFPIKLLESLDNEPIGP
jgi:hypothetical protein